MGLADEERSGLNERQGADIRLRVYLQPQPVRMFLLGFSSGLPLLLILGTLSFWLREAGLI